MKCDACGSESDFDAGFVKRRATFGRRAKGFCPVCWVKRGNLHLAWFLPMLLLATALGYVREQITPGSGSLLMNVGVVGLFTVLTIIPHELGHVIGGRLAGWRVLQVVIGV